jgi:Amidohydrolase family
MKRILFVLCLLFAGCTHTTPADLAIRDIAVVDVVDGSVHPHQTVLVLDNRIVAVEPAGTVKPPDQAEVIEGTGGYLIPGLWDAHVHSAGSLAWHFPLYIAYGITSVRNMHTSLDNPLDVVLSIKRRVAAGELLGPRFLANGAVVDGDPPVWDGSVVVRNAEEARVAVDRLADSGADFIKVYDFVSREAYFAILDEAGQRGIPVDGHLPIPVKPEEAAAAGQRTIEHTSGIGMGCSSDADAIRRDFARYVAERPGMSAYPDGMVAFFTLVRRSIDTQDLELCRQTARLFHQHGVVSVPTLVANAGSDPQGFVADAKRMALVPPPVREEWRTMAEGPDPIGELLGPVDAAILNRVRVLHEEGNLILAGTDVGNPFLVPGLSLHRELGRLTEAGLSPLEALQAATLLPARVFGLEDSLGTVETGKFADLVILDANPLDDIANTKRIRAVIAKGRLFRRPDLDQLQHRVATMKLDEEEQE